MINLMFCLNGKFMDGIIISLLSITKHTNEQLNVYVLTVDLHELDPAFTPFTQNQVEVLNKIVKAKNPSSNVTLIDITEMFKQEMMKTANMKTHYTPYILIRLFSDKIPELPDKILYLDCDIVCYKDIKEIFDTDMTNYEVGVATDAIGRHFINKKYINSGVVLMNLKKIRENGSFEKARDMVKNRTMAMPDQTAIYKCCKEKIYFPDKYNEQKKRKDDTIIRHFSMTIKWLPFFRLVNIKPWHIDRVHNEYKIFDYEDILQEYLEINKQYKENKSGGNYEKNKI